LTENCNKFGYRACSSPNLGSMLWSATVASEIVITCEGSLQ
jgi:hypothetical protein